jgi:two-component system sensor histidine kinase DesK
MINWKNGVNNHLSSGKLIWLAYLGFVFIDPVLDPRPWIWTVTLVSIAVFLPLYFAFMDDTCQTTRQRWLVAGIVALGALTLPFTSGAMTYFIYAAALSPFCLRPRWVLATFLVEVAIMSAEARWIHHGGLRVSWYTVGFDSFLMLVVGGSNILFAQQRRADKKLRMKQEEIEALAAVAERERIARDLHDVLGHTLSVIVLKAELAGRLLDGGAEDAAERARAEIGDVERTSRTALAEVREAIGGYRSRGLPAEVETARKTLAAAGVELYVDAADLANTKLSAAEETVLALALREAVTNIVRHAQARTCRLRFVEDQGLRRLIVADDGQNAATREGNGLRGMRERVEALGGKLSLRRDDGTMLEVALPAPGEPLTA